MISIPFDVNDSKLRESFFNHIFIDAIAVLTEQTQPLWGNMTAQHMVEHVIWAFQCSTGKLNVACHTPENLLERAKRFLYDNRQTPHCFKNPLLGEIPPALQLSSLKEAKHVLEEELALFLKHFQEHPDRKHVHPIFGSLGTEEWQRSHFKHCFHHLLQFGLISEPSQST